MTSSKRSSHAVGMKFREQWCAYERCLVPAQNKKSRNCTKLHETHIKELAKMKTKTEDIKQIASSVNYLSLMLLAIKNHRHSNFLFFTVLLSWSSFFTVAASNSAFSSVVLLASSSSSDSVAVASSKMATTPGAAAVTTSTKKLVKGVIAVAQKELKKSRDPNKAKQMQSYLKTDMPMYGLQRPARAAVEKKIYSYLEEKGGYDYKTKSPNQMPIDFYRQCVSEFWNFPYREEKYLAIDIALKYQNCITLECIDLYESMLREDYMWWDLVDPIATNLVGHITRNTMNNNQDDDKSAKDGKRLERILRKWINDENMWIRRTAILAQLKSKQSTNEDLLFEFCTLRMHEKEFFIRKAIGWVLRDYSRTNPYAVQAFLHKEKSNLSGLSYREGSKLLVKQGRM